MRVAIDTRPARRLRVTFVITGLHVGGAEVMLLKLLSGLDRSRFESSVVTLASPGPLSGELPGLGVPLYSLGLAPGHWSPAALVRLVRCLRGLRPDILQGWMYHGNLAAQVAAVFLPGRVPVIWNIRGTVTDLSTESFSTAAIVWLGARLSRFPSSVINNSEVSARMHHEHLGYSNRNVIVIANGFDTTRFRPDPEARRTFRGQLHIPQDDFVIGHIGRLHPMKDHETLLEAFALAVTSVPALRLVLVGADVEGRSVKLHELAQRLQINERVHYLGPRNDIPQLLPGFDLATLTSSYGEGFPNAIGEAMACGVPSVVTDVGDSALLVDDPRTVVSTRNPAALAQAWLRIARAPQDERLRFGELARTRIVDHFSLQAIVRRYEELYERTVANGGSH